MEYQLSDITLLIGTIMGAACISVVLIVYSRKQVYGIGGSSLTLSGIILLGLSIWKTIEISVEPQGGIQAKFNAFENKITNEISLASDRIDAVTQFTSMVKKIDDQANKDAKEIDVLVKLDQDLTENALVCHDSPLERRHILLLSMDRKRLIQVEASGSFDCDQNREKEIIRVGGRDFENLLGKDYETTSTFAYAYPSPLGYMAVPLPPKRVSD